MKILIFLLFSFSSAFATFELLPIEKQLREEVFVRQWGLSQAECELLTSKLRLAEERSDFEAMLTKLFHAAKTFKARPFDSSAWDQYPDAVDIEPTHKVLADTAAVRVLEVVIEPDYVQAYHTHKHGGIIVDLVNSDFIFYQDGGEQLLSALDDPVFVHIEGQRLHTTKNVGQTTYVGLHFELKS